MSADTAVTSIPTPHGAFLVALVCASVCLVACSKSESPAPAKPPPVAEPAVVTPAPESVVTPPPTPAPTVELHIPGTPEAKTFVAANVVHRHPTHATKATHAPATAYDVAYRNAAKADRLLQRHAYVVSFDDAAATNAVALDRAYR